MVQGFSSKIVEAARAYSFQDLLLLPGLSKVEPSEVNLASAASRRIGLNIPFISSPMDTVTESEMAIALARMGALGVIHRNCSADEELDMVKRVKRSESFIIRDVVTIGPERTVGEAFEAMERNAINGLPVVEDGKIVGIITGRDVRFADPGLQVARAMSRSPIVAREPLDPVQAVDLMREHKIEKLPIVDAEGKLTGLITYKDVHSREQYKSSTRDVEGRLVVGAAVSPFDIERAKALSKYADLLVLDVAHYHNARAIASTKEMLKQIDDVDVIFGNIGTKQAALDIASAFDNVGGFRVGMGGGSVCTTTELTKAGSPTAFATAQVADAVNELGLDSKVIADGGIRGAGDIALSLALGADAVMMGYVFAGCKESPGETTSVEGRMYKLHRGMGSASARERRMALDRYSQPTKGIPEGTEAWVPYKGEVASVVGELTAALMAAMGYAGAASLQELKEAAVIALTTGGSHTRPSDMVFRFS